MDPRKAAIILLLVYGGVLVWILPPLDELRWRDEVAAQQSSRVERQKGAARAGGAENRPGGAENRPGGAENRPGGAEYRAGGALDPATGPGKNGARARGKRAAAGGPAPDDEGAAKAMPSAGARAPADGGAAVRGKVPGPTPAPGPNAKQADAGQASGARPTASEQPPATKRADAKPTDGTKSAGGAPVAAAQRATMATDEGQVATSSPKRESPAAPGSTKSSPQPVAAKLPAALESDGPGADVAPPVDGAPSARISLSADFANSTPDAAVSVRAEVSGGAPAQRMLAAWLRRLGGPPEESDLFGSTGISVAAGSGLSLRVPPGLDLLVELRVGQRSELCEVDALPAGTEHLLAIDLGADAAHGPGAATSDGDTTPRVREMASLVEAAAGPRVPLRDPGATGTGATGTGASGTGASGAALGAVAEASAPGDPSVATEVPAAGSRRQRATKMPVVPTADWILELVEARSQAPLAGALVRLEPAVQDPSLVERVRAWSSREGGDPLVAAALGSAGCRADDQGRLELALPAGIAFHLECAGEDLAHPDASLEVAPLERAERRSLRLDLVLANAPTGDAVPGVPSGERAPSAPLEARALEAGAALDAADRPPAEADPVPTADAGLGASSPPGLPPGSPPSYGDRSGATTLARLRGFVIDQEGKGIAGLSVWLVFPWGAADHSPRRLRFEDRLRAEARTGRDGSFAFLDVPDGRWMVGVAPAGTPRSPDADTDISRIARSVELTPGRAPSDVLLRVGRGLRLKGRVTDSRGKAAGLLSISAVEEGVTGSLWARTDADGSFDLGPLSPGPCTVTVRVSDEGEQRFDALEAGSNDLLLRLSATASVAGTVLDEVGQRAAASALRVLRPYAQPPVTVLTREVEVGRFDLSDLEIGVYRLVATTEDHRIAISSDLDLLPDARVPDVELILGAGAELVVQVRGAEGPVTVTIARGTRIFAVGSLGPGVEWHQTVPGGSLSVSLLSPEGVVLDQLRVTGVAGEVHDVVFDVSGR